jgi:hypothetical protein
MYYKFYTQSTEFPFNSPIIHLVHTAWTKELFIYLANDEETTDFIAHRLKPF